MTSDDRTDDLDTRLRQWGARARTAATHTVVPELAPTGVWRRITSTRARRSAVVLVAAAVAAAVIVPMTLLRPAPSMTSPDLADSHPSSAARSSTPAPAPPGAVISAVEAVIVPNQSSGGSLTVHYVRTGLQQAEALVDPRNSTDPSRRIAQQPGREVGPVWLAAADGQFVANAVPRPAGSAAPSGDSIYVIVTVDGHVLSWQLGQERAPDLSALGPVATVQIPLTPIDRTPADQVPSNAGSSGASVSPVAGPANTRPVTFQGLTVDVPSDWPLNVVPRCGIRPEPEGSVLIPPVAAACVGGAPPQTMTTVEFLGGLTVLPDRTDGAAIRWTGTGVGDVGGVEVLTAEGISDNKGETPNDAVGPPLNVRAVVAPSLKTAVIVTSPSRETAIRIAKSLRFSDVDAHGCGTIGDDTLELLPLSSLPAAMVPHPNIFSDTPTSISVCRYVEGRLQQGSTATGYAVTELMRLLHAAPPGTFRMPVGSYLPAQCRDPRKPAGDPDSRTVDDSEGYRLIAHYPGGRIEVAIARIGVCGELGVSTRGTRVQPTYQIARWLGDQLGSGRFSGYLPGNPYPPPSPALSTSTSGR